MRKLVLTTLLLVLVGAVAAAWLSSSTPSGSAIGDINLAEDRIPGTGTIGFGVPPRQNPTAPARSSFTAGGTARAASPESSLLVPEMTIASSGLQAPAYGAPSAFRESLAQNASGSSGTRTGRQNRSSSGSRGFGSLGFGAGGVGGGGGGATVAPREPAPARERTTFTAERAAPPAATPAPAQRPSPPSSGGGNGGGGGSAAPPAVAAAPLPVVAAPIIAGPEPAPAAPPVVGIVPPFSPGASPSASPTPEPTTMLLLGTGIAGLYRMRRYLE
jgi:PEP-CTERM motif